jgi:hypothetical protein
MRLSSLFFSFFCFATFTCPVCVANLINAREHWALIELPNDGGCIITTLLCAESISQGKLIVSVSKFKYKAKNGVQPADMLTHLARSGEIKFGDDGLYRIGRSYTMFRYSGDELAAFEKQVSEYHGRNSLISHLKAITEEYSALDQNQLAKFTTIALIAGCEVVWIPPESLPQFACPAGQAGGSI